VTFSVQRVRPHVNFNPTPVTAALAGVFSKYGQVESSGSVELIAGTLLLVALPAHAFVMGLAYRQAPGAKGLDTALLKRVGAWLGAAAITVALINKLGV
jgi:hypothetical protein